MAIKIDPALPVTVTVDFNSPQAGAYRLWHKNPGEIISTEFGSGTDLGPITPPAYPFAAAGLEQDSQVSYHIKLFGKEAQPYSVTLTLAQKGVALPGGTVLVRGNTDDDGFADLRDKIKFSV